MMHSSQVPGGFDALRRLLELLKNPEELKANLETLDKAERSIIAQRTEAFEAIGKANADLEKREKAVSEREAKAEKDHVELRSGEGRLAKAEAAHVDRVQAHNDKVTEDFADIAKESKGLEEAKADFDARAKAKTAELETLEKQLKQALAENAKAAEALANERAETNRQREAYEERLKKLREVIA